jgi:hypothetical protein
MTTLSFLNLPTKHGCTRVWHLKWSKSETSDFDAGGSIHHPDEAQIVSNCLSFTASRKPSSASLVFFQLGSLSIVSSQRTMFG